MSRQRSRRLLVAGTGTGIGKTRVTALLADASRRRGVAVSALKPIESGYTDADRSDAATIARAAGHEPIAPLYSFAPPVSPHLAAEAVGIQIEPARIMDWVAEREAELGTGVTLIETAGGLFSPLSLTADGTDLLPMAPWLLVASNRLGVLHDVRVLLQATSPQRPVAIVLSDVLPDHSSDQNPSELRRLTQLEVLRFRHEDPAEAELTDLLDRLALQ